MGTVQITRTFYLLGGLDDFVNTNQDLDWFLGGGIRFTDDDIKSLLGMFAGASKLPATLRPAATAARRTVATAEVKSVCGLVHSRLAL